MQAPELEAPFTWVAENGTPPADGQASGAPAGQTFDSLPSPAGTPNSGLPAAPAPGADMHVQAQGADTTVVQASGADMPVQASGIDFFSVDVLLPIFLAFATLIILSIGLRQSRLLARRGVLLFLAVCSFSLTVCLAADYHLASSIPGWLLNLTPLGLTALYLLIGGVGKKPLIWGAGLATPGLWFFAQRLDGLYFHLSRHTMPLPQDPAWFLLFGAALFALMHVARIQKFWDALEQPELTASFCYAMVGFWLLSLGETSVLGLFAFPVYIWTAVLLVLAGVGLWVARLLGDIALTICCGFGIIGVLYSFGVYVFAPAAA